MTTEHERLVICRTCNGKGNHTPEYGEAIALLQATCDAGNIDTLIEDAIVVMRIKKSRRDHVRRMLNTFCKMAGKFTGT